MSSASNSKSGWEGSRYMNIKCGYGKRALVRICENAKNKNRLYYSCEDSACGWLSWCTPSNVEKMHQLLKA